ncbi:hypothetical protein ABQY74_020385 [Xanthomonas sp. WHRI 7064]|uniref:AbiTii domain-containing protein n=1 Tax=Xanthomonas sp. WHRI 7064 TaxID=3161568 RepID=UPI0032E8B74D
MDVEVKPSAKALAEALGLSEDLLRAIELSQIPLTNVALMAARLARLLNDFDHQKIFEYESGGYPSSPTGVSPEVWRLAVLSGRTYKQKFKEEVKTYARLESIEQLEALLEASKLGIDAARDPSVSISSANPNQYVGSGSGNWAERNRLHQSISEASAKLSSRRSFIYSYVLQKNLELKFSGIAGDAFSRIRLVADELIGITVPSAAQKFIAIYENLQSDNPEDWSNAVHSCRRILQDLADHLFPATGTPRKKLIGGKEVRISLGADNYINRLVCFTEDNSTSERSEEIVGSQLTYLGDRLDSLFRAAQKGSHATISTRDEADRYVVYTYMLVADLLRLAAPASQ